MIKQENNEIVDLIKTPPYKADDYISLKTMLKSKSFLKNKEPLSVPLGIDEHGEIMFYNFKKEGDLLIAGKYATGKTTCLYSILTSLFVKNSPDNMNIYFVDHLKIDTIPLKFSPYMKKSEGIYLSKQFYDMQEWLQAEVALRKGNKNKLPNIFVVIRELCEFNVMLNEKNSNNFFENFKGVNELGIYFIALTFRPTPNTITEIVKQHFKNRISFAFTREEDSNVVIDREGAEGLKECGNAILKYNQDFYNLKMPYIAENDLKDITVHLIDKYELKK